MPWKTYTVANEHTFAKLLIEDEEPEFPTDEEIRALGWDPEDAELQCSLLAEDWNGHRAGARVLHTLALPDYQFAVEAPMTLSELSTTTGIHRASTVDIKRGIEELLSDVPPESRKDFIDEDLASAIHELISRGHVDYLRDMGLA